MLTCVYWHSNHGNNEAPKVRCILWLLIHSKNSFHKTLCRVTAVLFAMCSTSAAIFLLHCKIWVFSSQWNYIKCIFCDKRCIYGSRLDIYIQELSNLCMVILAAWETSSKFLFLTLIRMIHTNAGCLLSFTKRTFLLYRTPLSKRLRLHMDLISLWATSTKHLLSPNWQQLKCAQSQYQFGLSRLLRWMQS